MDLRAIRQVAVVSMGCAVMSMRGQRGNLAVGG